MTATPFFWKPRLSKRQLAFVFHFNGKRNGMGPIVLKVWQKEKTASFLIITEIP